MRWLVVMLAGVLGVAGWARAEIRFPAPEFRGEYRLPETVVAPLRRAPVMAYVDVALLAAALGVGIYLIYRKRSRAAVWGLMIFSLVYFGFYRQGCVCPIGSIQNVASAAGGHGALPWVVGAFFLLPLGVALFAGRVFCAGVCPLGAIQDVMLWRPVKVPGWLEQALGLFAYLYLGLGVLYAALGSRFLICEYDPFVGFFRLSATAQMLFFGGLLLVLSMFVGRVYCRFICPYSVLLRWLSPFASKQVSITPAGCVDCRLCESACPFGAIRHPTPSRPTMSATAGRELLVRLIALTPLMVGVLGLLGYWAGPALARLDPTVRLAQRIGLEEKQLVSGMTLESEAFRSSGQSIEQLYIQGRAMEKRFHWGGAGLGGYMGLVVGLRLIGQTVRRRRVGYTTDPAGCVACARCYKSCPVEVEHKAELAGSVV